MAPNPTELTRLFFMAVPRFEFRGVLGSGGMGTVFEAWDLDLDSEVAIKVVSELSPRPEERADVLRRLKNEVLINRRLKHQAIARTFDYGEASGLPYITMELIHGTDLKRLLGGAPLSVAEALAMIRQVAEACAAAHAAGVVHRDIKPENVMVQPDGRVAVLDFGLAFSAEQGRVTPRGIAVGTPVYMSPEQLKGEPTDARTDVYALGVVFFELLTGRPPFPTGTVAEIAFQHMHLRPDLSLLSERGAPASIIDLIGRCLEKSPENRPADAGDFLSKLDLPEAIEVEEPVKRRRRVLIVDDDPLIRGVLSTLVGRMGADVIQSENGEDALSVLGETVPDLILLDLVMPAMDGFDTLCVLRSMPRVSRTPVVLVSAHDDRQNRAFGKNIGANGFLEKPLDLPKVKRVIEQWLA